MNDKITMPNKRKKLSKKLNAKYPSSSRRNKRKTPVIKEEKSKKYDLEERTAKFGEDIIENKRINLT